MSSMITIMHPATAVTHSLCCPFVSPDYNSLIVTTTHSISIYNMNNDINFIEEECQNLQTHSSLINEREEKSKLEKANNSKIDNLDSKKLNIGLDFEFANENGPLMKNLDASKLKNKTDLDKNPHLILVATVPVFGTISSIVSFRIAPSRRHAIAISFMEDAKISVVEYDDARNSLKTVSLHYLEDDVLKDGKSQMHHRVEAPLRSDPHSICTAYILFDTKLVLLPIREASELEDFENGTNNSQAPAPVRKHVIVDIAQRLGVRNVLDYCFLYGYSEPTLLILHENTQTWSAKLHDKVNTVCCTAVSLGIERNQYPIIWTVKSLPHDSYRLVPLKKSIGGGAIVIGHNSLIHVNQRALYGLSTNDFISLNFSHPESMAVKLEKQEDISLLLEVISYTFLSNNVLALSLNSGELYLAHIIGSGNLVQKIILKKATNTVIASTMNIVNNKFLFLGSRLGNSVLFEFREKNKRKDREDSVDTKTNKKRKIDTKSLANADDFLSLLEIETEDKVSDPSVEVKNDSEFLKEYSFSLIDTFINIGPITAAATGKVQVLNSDTQIKSKTDSRLEIATCSGYNKTGAIHSLQKSVRPSYISSHRILLKSLPKKTITSLHYIDHNDESIGRVFVASTDTESFTLKSLHVNNDEFHSLTLEEKSKLNTKESTLAAGSLTLDRSVSVQVCRSKVTVIKDSRVMFTKEFVVPVYSAHIIAPYVLLHLEDGSLKLLTCSKERKLTTKTIVVSMSSKNSYDDQENFTPEAITSASLYLNKSRNKSLFSYKENIEDSDFIVSDYLAVICWTNGAMEIYSVPDFKCLFTFMQFNDLYSLIFDQNPSQSERDEFSRKNKADSLYVREALLNSIGTSEENPYLFVRMSDNSFHVYQSFTFISERASKSSITQMDSFHQINDSRLSKLRFCKVEHQYFGPTLSRKARPKLHLDHFTRERRLSIFDKRFDLGTRRIIQFDSIGENYRGIFVCGEFPIWIFANNHNEIRFHPMTLDGFITSFVPVSNGKFLYITPNASNLKSHGDLEFNEDIKSDKVTTIELFLRASKLPSEYIYDTHWPTRYIPLKKTPHHIVFERETNTYVVAVSKPISFEREDETLEGRFPKPQSLMFQVLLFNSRWEKLDNLEFDEFEQVLSMRVVSLMERGEDAYTPDPTHDRGLVTLLAIGTGYGGSEDETSKGRILLYDFIGSIEGDQHFKFEKIGELELKGPASAIESVGGYLAVSIGTKVNTYFYNWEENEIVQASFFDSQYFSTSMKSIKDYILYGDMYDSLNLLRWNENGHQLSLLGKDVHRLLTYEVEFMYSGKELGMVVSDEEMNLQIFNYTPEEAETHGGRWLSPISDIHIGSHINTMMRLPCRKEGLDKFTIDTDSELIIFATLEGEIGSLVPLDSSQFKSLFMLQSQLFTQIPHACGLHPKAFRLFQPNAYNPFHIHKKNILDGELLRQYMHLDQKLQVLIAKQIGLKPIDLIKAFKNGIIKSSYF